MYRIQQFIDNFERFAFLREVDGDLNPTAQDPIVVLGREYSPENQVTRVWFLATSQQDVDGQGVTTVPHRVVSSKIRPGEPSLPADPTVRGIGGVGVEALHHMKQAQVRRDKEAAQFTAYCREWHQHLATIASQEKRIQQLESDLKAADVNVRDLAERNAALANELQQVQAEATALREEKSLTHRVRAWGRRWKR